MPPKSTVSDIERYAFVTSQLEYFNEKIIEVFSLYIKLLTAIVGGLIWLQTQPNFETIWARAKSLAVLIVAVIASASIVLILFNVDSWFGFRRAEAKLNRKAPTPRRWLSIRQELAMIAVIALTSLPMAIIMWNLGS
jgi:hypothetical protein